MISLTNDFRSVGIPAGIDLKPSTKPLPGYPENESSLFYFDLCQRQVARCVAVPYAAAVGGVGRGAGHPGSFPFRTHRAQFEQ